MPDGPFGFPEEAEKLLTETLPNYPLERILLVVKLMGVFLFFVAILPVLMAEPVEVENESKKSEEATNTKLKGKHRGKKSGKRKETKVQQHATKDKNTGPHDEDEVVYAVHPMSGVLSVLGCLVFLPLVLILSSPDNYYTPNGVFQVPLLTRKECQQILDMADAAAKANYEDAKSVQAMYELTGGEMDENSNTKSLLEEPQGWQKLRHASYPTTDLNLITDPFTREDRDWIKQKLDARLAPIIQRIYGVPPSAIRATDMFVVRYDENKRTFLANHTDDGKISFNVLLDNNFEGGGTLFWSRAHEEPFAYVQPKQVGQVLLHSALLNHEGVHVDRGRRTIFVGFLEVDRVDPFTEDGQVMTGLSFWSSWGSLPWTINKFKQGNEAAHRRLVDDEDNDDWKNNVYVRSFFLLASQYLGVVSDVLLPHFASDLVEDKDRDAFLAALDKTYEKDEAGDGDASWFSGQQVAVDINGKVSFAWQTRQEYGHRFNEL